MHRWYTQPFLDFVMGIAQKCITNSVYSELHDYIGLVNSEHSRNTIKDIYILHSNRYIDNIASISGGTHLFYDIAVNNDSNGQVEINVVFSMDGG